MTLSLSQHHPEHLSCPSLCHLVPLGILPTGLILLRTLSSDPDQAYFLFVPRSGGAGAPLFVTVHGVTRNAYAHAYAFQSFADRAGVVLIAPLFTQAHFSDYQRLGRTGKRADINLHKIISEVGDLTGAQTDKVFLFGYSGGGQFVHRYAMAYPHRVARYVIGAAGWYTFPDPALPYPRGIRSRAQLPDIHFTPRQFLTVPAAVLVGENDIRCDDQLNMSTRIQQQQGRTRLERGWRWIQAMRQAALGHNLNAEYLFQSLPQVNHSFATCMQHGQMGQHIFAFLFGSRTTHHDSYLDPYLDPRFASSVIRSRRPVHGKRQAHCLCRTHSRRCA